MSIELSKRFIKGLQEYNLTKEDIQGWHYVGGGHTTNPILNIVLKERFHRHFPGEDVPELEHRCVCGHPIQENAFITDGSNILVLGSCCVRRFLPNGTKLTCTRCKRPYKGKHRVCGTCRGY